MKDAREADDAPEVAPAPDVSDTPEMRGWENCPHATADDVRAWLRDGPMEAWEYDPRFVQRIDYQGEGDKLGLFTPMIDGRTGRRVGDGIDVYDHTGSRDDLRAAHLKERIVTPDELRRNEIRETKLTVAHEVGHSVWYRASPALRERWEREVYDRTAKADYPTAYASERPSDDFAETYALAMVDPRRLVHTLGSRRHELLQEIRADAKVHSQRGSPD